MGEMELSQNYYIQSTLSNSNSTGDEKMFLSQKVRITEIRITEVFVRRFSWDVKICSN